MVNNTQIMLSDDIGCLESLKKIDVTLFPNHFARSGRLKPLRGAQINGKPLQWTSVEV